MVKRKVDAPPTDFLVGLGTGKKVSIYNPSNTSNAPQLKANPTTATNVYIRPNAYVRVVLDGNKREPVILVGAAPSGFFYQQTITIHTGHTVTFQATAFTTRFQARRRR